MFLPDENIHGMAGGTKEGGLVVENHTDGDFFQKRTQTAFVREGMLKSDTLEMGEHFCGDASTKEDAAESHALEGHITAFGGETADKNFQGFDAHRALAGIREFGDDDTVIAGLECEGDFGEFFSASGLAEEFVDILNAHPGNDTFAADVAVEFFQVLEEGDFNIVARSKIGVAALAGPDAVAFAVPEETGFSKSGARGDDAAVAFCIRITFHESRKIGGFEFGDAEGVGGEIVDDSDAGNGELVSNFGGIDSPAEIGGFCPSILDRAGNAEACAGQADVAGQLREKLADDGIEAGMGTAWKPCGLLDDHFLSGRVFEQANDGEVCLGAPDISGENVCGIRNFSHEERAVGSNARYGLLWRGADRMRWGPKCPLRSSGNRARVEPARHRE